MDIALGVVAVTAMEAVAVVAMEVAVVAMGVAAVEDRVDPGDPVPLELRSSKRKSYLFVTLPSNEWS